MSFISELQRRNVVRMAIGYLASAWLLIEVLETLFPIFGLPETSVRVVSYFAVDKFVLDPARDADIAQAARDEGRADALVESYGDKSIAVLPFADLSAGSILKPGIPSGSTRG